MKHLVVINPHSFIVPDSLNQFQAHLAAGFAAEQVPDYKVHISRYPRDAIAVISHYINSVPDNETVRVYAVGGDGILFDCLNGMVAFKNAELTCMPYGNSNDFVRAFGNESMSAFRDIRKLIHAPAHPVDIIHCGANYAINEANVGLIGQTIVHANALFPRLPKKWLRKNIGLAFSLCGLWAILNDNATKQHYSVRVDGEDMSGCYINIQMANAPCNGGVMLANPYAKPDDGLIDLIFFDSCPNLKILRSIGNYQKGLFEKFDFYRHKSCRVIEVKSDTMMRVQIDGEGFYAKEIKFEIVPGGIRFFAPEGLDFVDYSHKAYKSAARKAGGRK